MHDEEIADLIGTIMKEANENVAAIQACEDDYHQHVCLWCKLIELSWTRSVTVFTN